MLLLTLFSIHVSTTEEHLRWTKRDKERFQLRLFKRTEVKRDQFAGESNSGLCSRKNERKTLLNVEMQAHFVLFNTVLLLALSPSNCIGVLSKKCKLIPQPYTHTHTHSHTHIHLKQGQKSALCYQQSPLPPPPAAWLPFFVFQEK